MSCLASAYSNTRYAPPGFLARLADAASTPLRLVRRERQRTRHAVAFGALDPHTLDDIGLRRSVFVAAESDPYGPG